MKHILPLLCMTFALNAWGQTSIQVQTKSENYSFSDAYRITFEDGGRVQVFHTQSQGEVRIPIGDLKQIHFNDTIFSLANQIKSLENCEIMKTILFEGGNLLPSYLFSSYLNTASVSHVFIPNDEAFQSIPVVFKQSPYIPCVLSVTLDKTADFPLKGRLRRYNQETGEVGASLGSDIPTQQLVVFLKRLALNQFATGNDTYLKTVAGSTIRKSENGYQGTYHLEASHSSEYQRDDEVHVVQEILVPENKKCVVTDAVISESLANSYDVLQDMAPKFLTLLTDVPLDLLNFIGFIEFDSWYERYDPDISYFKVLDSEQRKFRWNSSKVNFTILAPTDEAVDEAFRNGSLFTWSEIVKFAENLMASSDWETQGRQQVVEKVSDLLSFINRHILFGNVVTDIPVNSELSVPTCAVTSGYSSRSVSVQRDGLDGFKIEGAQVTPGSIHYVKEADDSDYTFFYSDEVQTGIVMQIDKAITNK